MGNYLQSLRVPPPAPNGEDERSHPLYYDWSLPKWSPFRVDGGGGGGAQQATSVASSSGSQPVQGINSAAGSNVSLKPTNRYNDNRNNNNDQGQDHHHHHKTQLTAANKSIASATPGAKLATASDSNPQPKPTSTAAAGTKLATAKSAIKSAKTAAKEAIQKSFKGTLTGRVDRANSKPVVVNADKTSKVAAKSPKSGSISSKVVKQPKTSGSGGKSTATATSSGHRKSLERNDATTTTNTPATIKEIGSMRPQTIDPSGSSVGIDEQAALKAATNVHTAPGNKN